MTDRSGSRPALTPREGQVLSLLVDGGTYWSIARHLGISPHTVDTYLRRLRGKTGAANRTQLIVWALSATGPPGARHASGEIDTGPAGRPAPEAPEAAPVSGPALPATPRSTIPAQER
ncbi:hypothetical protein GCM10018793_54690 [Streptomyces sulfonofaciens]|uniref:HTH luxR-type domain-containing protein n=1 Tax=Streptomyces sulfonofaciens TaxID=68272 RepID=A0A919L7N2_9ACTN|nr:helix-turn-helix transcriptional regulator [Streptomyces sulfonofaciens]GHH85691.1 hypothetical protein GCM10018793_54690 [Streptomyces sulfonofaciens]